jgi:GxxExxY protein
MSLAHEELTHDIIGAAIEVHRQLGPGFVERIYHNALCIELNHRRIAFDRETRIAVRHRGLPVGLHELDLVVEGRIVVELKALRRIEDVHFAIVRSYLRAMDLEHGLILSFAKAPLEIRRVTTELF